MNAEQLLQHFERISEAPDAMPRLRRFILDLAVRGKLVEQDSSDEPASELLKRIVAEKSRLVKAKEMRNPKPSDPIRDDELPITLPRNWVWARLCDIGRLAGGMTPSMNRSDFWGGDVVWLSPKDIKTDEISDSELKISALGLAETRLESYRPGCLFIVARSGILKRTFPVSINRVPSAANQDMKVLVPFLDGHERYLQIMFRGLTDFLLRDLVKTGTTVQSLRYAEFEQQPFPLPPFDEQHRIVARVDQLMSLCDQLEAAKAEREKCRDSLVAASLQGLNQPAEEEETFREHARFTFTNLPRITTRAAHIKQLRQTILNLAVRGKLVPQNPSDEPAAELLKRIGAEKAKHVKDRKLRTPKVPLTVSMSDEPIDLPATWEISPLGNIALVSDPNPSHRYPAYDDGTVPILSTQEFYGHDDWNMGTAKLVHEDFFRFQQDNCRFSDGDIVFARKGRIGLPRFLPKLDKYTFSHTVFLVKPLDDVLPTYLLWALRRDAAVSWLTKEMNQNTGVPTLGKDKTERLPISLPPLAEQHRIVEKVDELMAICDQLDAQITVTEQDSRRYLEAVLREALSPALVEAS